MKPYTEQELARVAASIRLTGELLEANGSRASNATEGWQRGPRSANLDPDSGGWRYDETGEPIPNDTTGEAGITTDPYGDTHTRYLHLVRVADRVCTELRKTLYASCPQATQPDSFDPDTPAQISAAGWCVSCHRDSGYCEPVSMRPDGSRRYRDYCTWCGTYIANARKQPKAKKKRKTELAEKSYWPPLELIQAHHRGDRITQQMVERALGKQDRKAS